MEFCKVTLIIAVTEDQPRPDKYPIAALMAAGDDWEVLGEEFIEADDLEEATLAAR
jgi:hypothetical protein